MKKMLNQTLVKKKARGIKAVVLDGDGVIFPSQVLMTVDEKGEYKVAMQRRDHKDGQGMSLLRACGIRFAFITAEKNGFAAAVAGKLNKLKSARSESNPGGWVPIDVFAGDIGKDKVTTIGTWLADNNISWHECAYMGDDMGDYEIMGKVALPSAPADAEQMILKRALFVARRNGGAGAIRDLCNFILDAQGIDQTKLDLH